MKTFFIPSEGDTKFLWKVMRISPPGLQSCSDVSFRSHIVRDFADHAEASSRRRNWWTNETDLFEPSL